MGEGGPGARWSDRRHVFVPLEKPKLHPRGGAAVR